MRSIAIINQKGGCGKTTTAINLAAVFARRGQRTLLVDMDPQSHCAAGLAVPDGRLDRSVGEALIASHDGSFDPRPYLWEVSRDLHLLPSTTRLAALEAPGGGLHQLPDRDRRLESLLAWLSPRFDICLIDCPPTIGLLTFNALRAAREALIPVETGFFALRGAQKQWKTIQRLIEHVNRPVICHLLPTLHKAESHNAQNVLAALKREFGSQLLSTVIHEHEALREAASYGQPVVEYAPDSAAERDFEDLADWLEERATAAPTIEIFSRQDAAGPDRSMALPPAAVPDDGDIDADSDDDDNVAEPRDRASELARRVRDMSKPANSTIEGKNTLPGDGDVNSRQGEHRARRFGAFPYRGGVRFVQPGFLPGLICVAGDFNSWSPSSTPLKYNADSEVYEAVVPLPPGRYEYRLVIDGAWTQDPYNDQVAEFGKEAGNIFEVGQFQADQLQEAQ